ncbi:MAG: hypothetical protein A3A27_02930 [Candidatus Wildermuthbacteria bacterium RIFCSPLOWO2_01_FULL_47_18]|uniref:histidine kinase n=2 Tax=Candidatus Wildermuthiibacteriota TaxID=1817923 RepID=A0A1G2RGJ5_9BACT|nr:MAG: hypothetical protein A3J68_00665 [Candidatus Wildermuthbacteria bacterium RIFCSPHIGHO2_02_FULL_48_16]OHA71966.1 MAG: hypothetical protein A3A27_02930 [Candidatus Wildermuthbacteria bacterium RIFCSPLOWO2_01_FULL_47_18]
MRLSINTIVGIIVLLLVLAGFLAVFFAVEKEQTVPLLMVAIANVEAVILLVFLITRGVLQPLKDYRKVIHKVGEGDFTVRMKLGAPKEIREFGQGLNDMIERLEHAQEREKQIERLKTEFVSLVAHQLRAPLSDIKWALDVLKDEDMGKLSAQQRSVLEKTVLSNERMIRLVNDLLNVTRIEEGRYLFHRELSQITDLLLVMVEAYKPAAARKKVEVVLELPQNPPPLLLLDKEKMELAIQNLVDNALKYSPAGGRVTISLVYDTKGVEVKVRDQGMGIPESEQKRVFEKFFRASNARAKEPEGTGLGLYLAKNIVEAHGGTMSFVSKENEGTTFSFKLQIK